MTLLVVYLLGRLLLVPIQAAALVVQRSRLNACSNQQRLNACSISVSSSACSLMARRRVSPDIVHVYVQVGSVVPGASRQGAGDWGKVALHDLVASTSLLLMLGLRSWLHKPMCGYTLHVCSLLALRNSCLLRA